jgi:hypothetical protein
MDNPLAFLSLYGLDRIVSDQDDPQLWAAVVAMYWPWPHAAEMDPVHYRFGIGQPAPNTEMRLQPTQVWAFERADAQRLQVCACPPSLITDAHLDKRLKAAVSISLLYCVSAEYWPYGAIVIARPSRQQTEVLAFAGFRMNGRMGWGHTEVWSPHKSDSWQATEAVAQWVS